MRRLIAVTGLLAFANLLLFQASGFCPLAGVHNQGTVVDESSHQGDHTAHSAPDRDPSPANERRHGADHASCLMMGPCLLSVDVDRVIAAAPPVHVAGVRAWSEIAPASLTTSPDIPPPRA